MFEIAIETFRVSFHLQWIKQPVEEGESVLHLVIPWNGRPRKALYMCGGPTHARVALEP